MGIEKQPECWVIKCDKCGYAHQSPTGSDVDEIHYPSEEQAKAAAYADNFDERDGKWFCEGCLYDIAEAEEAAADEVT